MVRLFGVRNAEFESGFINNTIFKALDVNTISLISGPKYWPFIFGHHYHIWKVFGYDCILYYATLVGIDHGYYEAAVIDGANRWQQILHVTLPSLLPTIITLTLMSIGKIFLVRSVLSVPMDSGPLLLSTIDTYVYRALITLNDYGESSAAEGVYQSVVGFMLVLCANLAVKIGERERTVLRKERETPWSKKTKVSGRRTHCDGHPFMLHLPIPSAHRVLHYGRAG